MHFSVLVLGDNPELQLDPYWELDLPADELARDYRAEFVAEVAPDRFAAAAEEIAAAAEAAEAPYAPRFRQFVREAAYAALFKDFFGGAPGPDGSWGYYANPDAKWDWFVLGGRCHGLLRLRPGCSGVSGENRRPPEARPADSGRCDQARFGDIAWAQTRTAFTPFAVLKDGEWHEQGAAGIWGNSPDAAADIRWEAAIDALLKGLPPETLVSVYDCHI